MDLSITPAFAKYIVDKALEDGTLTPAKVRHYRDMLHLDVEKMESWLSEVKEVGNTPRMAVRAPRGGVFRQRRGSQAVRRRRPIKVTPEIAASRKLQGRYISAIRRLPAGKRAKIQRIAKNEGREAAIKVMEGLG